MKKRAEKILKLHDDVAQLKANFDAHKSLSQQNRGGFWLKSRCTGCITYGNSLINRHDKPKGNQLLEQAHD